jgi:hypothetical protein
MLHVLTLLVFENSLTGSPSVLWFGYRKIVRNFFETAHAKGPQDAAGGFLKNQADLAVVRGKTSIQSAKDFFDFCNENLVSIYCFWYDFVCDKLVYEFEIFALYA